MSVVEYQDLTHILITLFSSLKLLLIIMGLSLEAKLNLQKEATRTITYSYYKSDTDPLIKSIKFLKIRYI